MIGKNYIKIFIRNFVRNKLYSFINIVGLAIGIAVFILIMLYVKNELNYDKSYKNANRIYKLSTGEGFSTVPPLAGVLKNQFPEIENITRISSDKTAYITYNINNNNKPINPFKINNVLYADSTFFKIFSYSVIAGNLQTALSEPDVIVLTKSTANRLFGEINVIGKTIQYNALFPSRKLTLTIKAIIEDPPSNSTLNYEGIISFLSLYKIKPNDINVDENWRDGYCNTYILLYKNISFSEFDKKIKEFMPLLEKEVYGIDPKSERATQRKAIMVPLTEVHFYHSNIRQLIGLLISLGFLILTIAIVNYVNLSIAKSSYKYREIGIKKVIGANRAELISQLIIESIIFCFIATFCAFIIVKSILPLFNKIIEKELDLGITDNPIILSWALIATIILGIISGLYPALKLTSENPIGSYSIKSKVLEKNVRHALITFQFATSIILLSGIIIILKQFDYIKTKNLGFNNKQILYTDINDNFYKNHNAFKQELLQNPKILGITGSQNELGQVCVTLNRKINGSDRFFQTLPVDPDFIKTIGLQLTKGRNFSWDMPGDPYQTIIISETAVKTFELKDKEIIGTQIFMYDKPARVIGVIKDIYFQSFHNKLDPFVLFYHPGSIGTFNIRINAKDMPGTLDYIKKIWNKYSPNFPFEYHFLDESYDALYKSDKKFGLLLSYFTGLAIFIACLGLFALAVYSTERRTKEIGIRKVNGARVLEVMSMLNKDFIKWVVIAFVIACPIAWYAMHKWLQNFAYKTELSWWIFAAAGSIALAIAMLTVSVQSYKAATRNPVESLRYE